MLPGLLKLLTLLELLVWLLQLVEKSRLLLVGIDFIRLSVENFTMGFFRWAPMVGLMDGTEW